MDDDRFLEFCTLLSLRLYDRGALDYLDHDDNIVCMVPYTRRCTDESVHSIVALRARAVSTRILSDNRRRCARHQCAQLVLNACVLGGRWLLRAGNKVSICDNVVGDARVLGKARERRASRKSRGCHKRTAVERFLRRNLGSFHAGQTKRG